MMLDRRPTIEVVTKLWKDWPSPQAQSVLRSMR
jgi:hypothetical protein